MERYQRLFTLSARQYLAGSPVIVTAGTLLKDNETDAVLGQLKYTSLSDIPIQYMDVTMIGYDPSAKEVCVAEHKYLDLTVARGQDFGSREAIPLSDSSVRSFSVRVTKVVKKDGTVWENSETFVPLPEPQTLPQKYQSGYAFAFGGNRFSPMKTEDLWICVCGAMNRNTEQTCISCGTDRDALFSANPEELRKAEIYDRAIQSSKEETEEAYRLAHNLLQTIPGHKDADEKATLFLEKAERIQKQKVESRKKEAAELALKKERLKKKLIKIVTITAPCVAAVVAFIIVWNTVIIPNGKYNAAIDLYDAGKYDEAITAFQALDGYKDSVEQISKCETAIQDAKYDAAVELYDAGKYNEAITAFQAMDGYKNSAERILECKYSAGVERLEAGDYGKAKALFYEAIGYKDARERFDSIESKPKIKITTDEDGKVRTTENSFNEQGYLIKSVSGSSSTEYIYDERGYLIKTVSDTSTFEYFYNERGSIVRTLFENRLNNGARFALYSGVVENMYDEQGKLLKSVTTYDGGRVETEDHSHDLDTYDERENLVKTVSETYTKEYSYDEHGNLLKETRTKTDGSTYTISYGGFVYFLKPVEA